MNKLIIGVAMAAAGAALFANAGKRRRREQRALEQSAIARWEDDTGAPASLFRQPAVDGAAVEELHSPAH